MKIFWIRYFLIDSFTIGMAPIQVCPHLFAEVNKIVECDL